MKISILINNNSNLTHINDCKTRNEFIAFTLKSLLLQHNINTTIHTCYPNAPKHSKLNTFSQSTHIIYINETGFYNSTIFLHHIKQYTNYTISIAMSPKYFNGEDLMFGFIKTTKPNYVHINIPINELYESKQMPPNLTILFTSNNDITNYICDDLKQISIDNNIIITTGIITHNVVTYDSPIIFDTYVDYIKHLSKINMYVLTKPCHDIYRLYECLSCGITIVSHKSFISYSIPTQNIYLYTNTISWSHIFQLLNTQHVTQSFEQRSNDFITTIISNLQPTTPLIPHLPVPLSTPTTNDDNVITKIYDILGIVHQEPKPKTKKFLLQNSILKF